MDAIEKAMHLFDRGLNCSQAILTAFGETYGLESESALRLGRPWGGGMGRMGQICGAVSGAIVLLGYAANGSTDEAEARNKLCAAIQKLVRRFEERNGTSICRELLGADFSSEEDQRKIKEEMLVTKRCPKFVKDASVILAELLED